VQGALPGDSETTLATKPWTTPQRQWLQRIVNQTKAITIVDREALDDDLLFSSGKAAAGRASTGCSSANWMGCCSSSSGRCGRRELALCPRKLA
jgi:hypothetical protein